MDIGQRLLRSLPEPSRRAKVHIRIAEAASATARWAIAQEQLTLAGQLLGDTDLAARAGVDALTAHVLLGALQPEAAVLAAHRALDVAERTDLPDTACQALEVIGRVARNRDLMAAEAAFTRQLDIATAHGMTVWVVRATHELGAVDLMSANRTDRLHRARELAAEVGALSVMATVDLQLAGSGVVSLDAARCLEAARRCQIAARRWHLDTGADRCVAVRGEGARNRRPPERDGTRPGRGGFDGTRRSSDRRDLGRLLVNLLATSGTARPRDGCLRHARWRCNGARPVSIRVRTVRSGRCCARCRTWTVIGPARR